MKVCGSTAKSSVAIEPHSDLVRWTISFFCSSSQSQRWPLAPPANISRPPGDNRRSLIDGEDNLMCHNNSQEVVLQTTIEELFMVVVFKHKAATIWSSLPKAIRLIKSPPTLNLSFPISCSVSKFHKRIPHSPPTANNGRYFPVATQVP